MSLIEFESDHPGVMNEQTFTISAAVRSARTEDGCVLLDLRHGRILSLNVVGSHIFELLQRGFDQPQIVDTIGREFGVVTQDVGADVIAFIETLKKHDILQSVGINGSL